MGYREDVRIDKHALDDEWVRQPLLIYDYVELLSDATQEKEELKNALDLLMAELDEDIRADPAFYGLKKNTEAEIKARIQRDEKVILAKKLFREAKKNENLIKGALRALEHKKLALEKLTDQWAIGYFADPNIPRDAKRLAERHRRKMESDILTRRIKGRKRDGEETPTE